MVSSSNVDCGGIENAMFISASSDAGVGGVVLLGKTSSVTVTSASKSLGVVFTKW